MYPEWLNEILRCPGTLNKMEIKGSNFVTGKKIYQVKDDILSIVFPDELSGSDAKYNRIYKYLAPFYDLNERVWSRLLFGIDLAEGRKQIVGLLGLKPGMRLLEVSPGPGVFQKLLRHEISDTGDLVALDLSMEMLRQCQKKNKDLNVHLVQGNAQYLPFEDGCFDALFHFGGVNLFNDPAKAIDEFIRVVKKDGIVSWGDEGISESYSNETRKKIAARINPGFLKTPPATPGTVYNSKKYDVYGGLAYLVVANKR